MSLVTIIIPYKNNLKYLFLALESIFLQTYKNFKILIIYDDEDKSDLKHIKNFLNKKKIKKFYSIKIFVNKKNLGAGESRNVGIKSSKGDLIAFIDADDYWYKNKLEKQIKFMDENSYQFIFCDYIIKSKNGEKIISYKNKFLDYSILLKSCDIGLSTVIISSDLIKENLFPKLITKEDYVVWLQITKKKINAYCLNETLVIWNKTHNSLSSNILQKIFDGYKVYRFYEKFNFIKSLFFLIILSFNSLKKK